MKQAITYGPGIRRAVRLMFAPTSAFVLLLGTLFAASARADDLDIYVKALSSSGGAPAILMQLDNSGSMKWSLTSTSSSNTSNLMLQRLYRMADVAMTQATGMKSTFKVGVSTYADQADGDGNTGRILADVKTLSDFVTISSPYSFGMSSEHDDVVQPYHTSSVTSTGVVRGNTTFAFGAVTTQSRVAPSIVGTTYSGGWPSTTDASLRALYYPEVTGSAGVAAGLQAGLRGNVVIWYKHNSNDKRVVFRLTAATANSYMSLTNEGGSTIMKAASLDNEAVSSDCASTGNLSCISIVNGSNSSSLEGGKWYRLVIGTDVVNQAGTFTLARNCYNSTSGTTAMTCTSTWEQETAPPAKPAGRVGLRFPRLEIPQGATITSARLRFKASTASTTVANATTPGLQWRVGIDSDVTPQQPGDGLFMRSLVSGAMGAWETINAWSSAESGADTELDVTSALGTYVAQSGWCGGDAVLAVDSRMTASTGTAAYLDPTYTRSAYAYDGTWPTDDLTFQEPKLVVTWTDTGVTPVGCDTRTVIAEVENSSDDVQQKADHSIDTDEASLTVSATQTAGLRFPLIPLPKGVTIEHAYLELIPAATVGTPPQIQVHAVDADNATPFPSLAGALDELLVSAAVDWTPATWVTPASTGWSGVLPANIATSPDLAAIINPILQRDGWNYDNGIELVLKSSSSTALTFRAWERHQTAGTTADRAEYGQFVARLRLEVSSATAPLATGLRTHRWVVNEEINGLTSSHNTPIFGSMVESAQYMTGRDGYTAPDLAIGDCGTNGIILLTDGEETGNNYDSTHRTAAQAMFNVTTPATTCSTTSTSSPTVSAVANQWKCTYNIAKGIYETGITVSGSKVSIRTDAIGFGPEFATSTTTYLQGLDGKGGGKFYNASDSTALTNAFQEIISKVSVPSTTIAASGVAVNALNRFEHLDQLYYSLFTPSVSVSWSGNLKRYRLSDSEVVDVNNMPAIDLEATGFFADTARSYWSDVTDGGVITTGGTAADNPAVDRKLYTYLDAAEPADTQLVDEVVAGAISNTQLGLLAGDLASKNTRVIDFLRQAPNSDATKPWGPAIHNSPRVVTYDINDETNPIITVFYADNRGILHAVDAGALSNDDAGINLANAALSDGEELFGFIPKELLLNAAELEANATKVTSDGYVYGLDGDLTLYRQDSDGDDSLDKVWLFAGMRRGGSNYYALDVTNARRDVAVDDRAPILKWVVRGGVSGTDFENMGQSWSGMVGGYVKVADTKTQVLMFSGGYDPQHHDDGSFSDVDGLGWTGDKQAGRGLYMVDPATGKALWKSSDLTTSEFPAMAHMLYSMVGTPRMLDRDRDGAVDALYVADLAGQIFRIELKKNAEDWTHLVSDVVLVAQLGATATGADPVADNRRFYDTLSLARYGSSIVIAIASGYREEPRSRKTEEAMIFLQDTGAYYSAAANTTLTMADLDDLTGTASNVGADVAKKGWYIYLDQSSAEKAIGSPVIFNGAVLYPIFNTQTADLACAPDIGQTNLYLVDFSGKGLAIDGDDSDTLPDRMVDIHLPGFGDTPQILFQDNGELAIAVGVRVLSPDDIQAKDMDGDGDDDECVGEGCKGFNHKVDDWFRAQWYQVDP